MTTTLLPIFAADFGTFISVVFLVIAFLGWVIYGSTADRRNQLEMEQRTDLVQSEWDRVQKAGEA